MLRAALGCESPFIIVLLATIEAVGMDPSQVEQQQVEMLRWCQESRRIVIQLFLDRFGNALFWVEYSLHQLLADVEVSLNDWLAVATTLDGTEPVVVDLLFV